MKMTIERKVLLAALAVVKPATGGSVPILSHVLISVAEKSAEFMCADLDIWLRARADCEADEKFAFTVSAGLLHSLVHSFSGSEVKLEIVKDRMVLTCGKSKYRLGILPAGDFPPAAAMRGAGEFKIPQAQLKTLLTRGGFCAADDESRFILQGTHLQVNGNITATSTDGKRLARLTTPVAGLGKKTVELIVPDRAVTELVRLLGDDELLLAEVAFLDNTVRFTFGNVMVTAKLIEGRFPRCEDVIPPLGARKAAVIYRLEMLECVKRCALIGPDVLLEFKKQTLNITAVADGQKIVGEASEAIAIQAGENSRIKFRAQYLIEALNHVDDDEIQFYGGFDQPGVFRVASSSWVAVIMPMLDPEPAAVAAAGQEGK